MLHRVRAGATTAASAGPALARVTFGETARVPGSEGLLEIHVPLRPLGPGPVPVELFAAHGTIRRARAGDVEYATDGARIVGWVRLDERTTGGLQATARRAYASIFAALDAGDARLPLRFWNYVPRINETLDGLERYRHFNVGRQEAFLAAGRTAFAGAPAACALGSRANELVVIFLAGREEPIAIENPRQVSAYHYPAEYGPRSPTFSRATLAGAAAPTLFISGTASIIGHRSQHPGDPVAQTRETFVNLRAVIDAANTRLGAARFALPGFQYTVYVRRRADLAAVRGQFLQEVGGTSAAAAAALFLEADICRAELLVEIEATGHAT